MAVGVLRVHVFGSINRKYILVSFPTYSTLGLFKHEVRGCTWHIQVLSSFMSDSACPGSMREQD